MHERKTAPTHTITGLQELHQQLLPTKLYLAKEVKWLNTRDYNCRMRRKEPESVAHVLAGCGAIVQSKFMEGHTNVLRILFFEILAKYKLELREDYAWFKPIKPKPVMGMIKWEPCGMSLFLLKRQKYEQTVLKCESLTRKKRKLL